MGEAEKGHFTATVFLFARAFVILLIVVAFIVRSFDPVWFDAPYTGPITTITYIQLIIANTCIALSIPTTLAWLFIPTRYYAFCTACDRWIDEFIRRRTLPRHETEEEPEEEIEPPKDLEKLPPPEEGEPVLPIPLRFEGTWILGPTGSGKSTLLSYLLYQDLELVYNDEASIIVFDSKGDFVPHIKRLAHFADDGYLKNKLNLYEPVPYLSLNPLDLGTTAQTIELFEYILVALLGAPLTAKQSTVLHATITAAKTIPGANLYTLYDLLLEKGKWREYEEYIRTCSEAPFFTSGQFDSTTFTETKNEAGWRIKRFISKNEILSQMFRATETKIDLGMSTPKVVLIDNSLGILGEEGQKFFARIIIAKILLEAQKRFLNNPRQNLPVFVYMDEFAMYGGDDAKIAEMLNRCRSVKIGLIMAHQHIKDLKNDLLKDSVLDCAIKIVRPDEEAPDLAQRIKMSADQLQSLPEGTWAASYRKPRQVARLEVPPSAAVWNEKQWPKMRGEQFQKILKQMRDRYGFEPPDEPQAPSSIIRPWKI